MGKYGKFFLTTAVICLLAAVGAIFIGREQDRIRSLYGDGPQTITVARLADKGYGDNVWVDVTDVELTPKYVSASRKGSISAVWFAAFPKGQADKTREIKVVLRSTRCKSEEEIAEKFKPRAVFRGAVINPTLLQPYDPYRALLQQQFPDMKLAPTIWEVDVDYVDKPSEQWAFGFYAAAGGLTLIGVLCVVAWGMSGKRR